MDLIPYGSLGSRCDPVMDMFVICVMPCIGRVVLQFGVDPSETSFCDPVAGFEVSP